MYSYQNDYVNIKDDPAKVYAIITNWELSKERKQMIDGLSYYNNDNPVIKKAKRWFYSKTKTKTDSNGNEATIGGGLVENKYVANFKIGYGIFHDIVSQKVNTLLNELPNIEQENGEKISNDFIKNYGYALKMAGIKASAQGVAYIFQDYFGEFKVFDSENVIGFFDDITGDLRTAIRYWKVFYNNGTNEKIYFELYKENSMITYSCLASASKFKIEKNETPYKFIKTIDFQNEEIKPDNFILPISVLWNNEAHTSDLTPNLKSKIDAIDLVTSGFANNIADFSELIWVINNYTGRNSEELEDFIANIQASRKLIVDGNGANVDAKQINIPTEARTKFVADRKLEIIEENGIIDTATMTGASLTTTAIKAATMKLQQRVSDFEWQVYNTATELIDIYQLYTNNIFDFDITFSKLLISNDTEIIDNAVKIRADISKKTLFEIYKRAGYIENVDDELKAVENDNLNKFSLSDFGDENGYSTQRNGQNVIENSTGTENAISNDLQQSQKASP